MKRKILIVDDDVAVLEILNEWLSQEGYQVKGFTEVNNIVKVIETFQPDVVLLDFLLHNKNGGELCLEIKTCPPYAQLPVLIFSACNQNTLQLDEYPFDAFILKPFDLYQLTEQLNFYVPPIDSENCQDQMV